ncbi:MAG: PAS domain S-box protein, partial [Anaerolineaceae bacterium]
MLDKNSFNDKIKLDARNMVIIEAIHEPVLILNIDLRILFANKNFYSTFRFKKNDVIGKQIFDLADKAWDIPEFHKIQTDFLTQETTSIFLQIEHDLAGSVKHGIYLNVIRFPGGNDKQSMIVLLFENIIEQKLKESTEFQKSIFETTSLPTAILNADKTILLVNKEFEKLSGYPKKEIENIKKFTEFIMPEFLPTVERNHEQRRVDPQKTPKHYEFQIKTRKGEIRDVLLNADLIPGTQESVVSLVDITERNKVEKALLESEEKFKFIFDNSVVGKTLVYPSGEMYINQACSEMLGYPKEELKHKQWRDIVHPDEIENFSAKMNTLLSGDSSSIRYMTRLVGKDGSIIWADILTSLRFDEKKKPMYYISTIIDLTDRIKMEEQLRESMEFQKTIFETTTMPTTILDEDKTILISNKQFELLSGFTKEEIEGKKKWMEFVDPEYLPAMKQYHEERRINPEKIPVQYEFKFINKKGDSRDILLSVDMIPGTLKSVACLFDITERKRNERALQEANTIINRSPAVAFLWKNEPDWPVEFVSENVKELFGYSAQEFMQGRIQFAKTIYSSDLERVIGEVTRYSKIEGMRSFSHEPYRILTKNNELKWVDDLTYIRRNEKGSITHYEGIVFDISKRRMIEEKLQISENKYRSVVEYAPLLINNFLPDGTITFVNKAYCDFFDEKYEDAIGSNIQSSISKQDREQVLTALTACTQESPVVVTENRVNVHGEMRWMRWTDCAFFDKDGKVIYYQSYGQDIHERKRVDQLLQALNQAAVAMGSVFSVDEIFDVVASELEQLDITCQFFPIDETRKRFLTKYLYFDPKLVKLIENLLGVKHENYSFPIDTIDAYQEALQKKKVIFIGETEYLLHKIIPSVAKKISKDIIKSFHSSKSIIAPLLVEEDAIGIFAVQSDHLKVEDVPIFTVFADQLAAAWKKVELLQDLKKTIDGTILTIAATVEMRDPYTAGHQTRVADLATAIASEMHLSDEQVESIH